MPIRRLVLLLVLTSLSCRKPPAQPMQTGARGEDATLGTVANDSLARAAAQFTQAFYDWYHEHDDRFDRAIAERPSAFAPELLKALRDDLAASAKSPSEIVGLDWDPFTASQDPCDPYEVDRTTRRGDTVLVAVKRACAAAALHPGPDIIAKLTHAGPTWVFVDFRHAGDTGTLLRDLATLRAGRDSATGRARQ